MRISATIGAIWFSTVLLLANGNGPGNQLQPSKLQNTGSFQKIIGGRSFDAARRVAKLPQGGYLLAGRTASHGTGDTDMNVVRINDIGEIVWDKRYGAEESEEANDIIATPDGGSIVVGYTESSEASRSIKDIWVVKLDPKGEILWQKTFGALESIDEATAITEAGDGGYIIVGNSIKIAEDATGDIIAIKINSSGEKVWEKTFGGLANEEANDVVKTNEGFAIVGNTESIGAGRWDAWVVRIDADGNELQSHVFGGKDNDMGNTLIQAKDGSFLMAGYSYSFAVSSLDAWVVRFDKSGTIVWNKNFGGMSTDEAFALYETESGDFLMAGYTEVFEPNSEFENISTEALNVFLVKIKPNGDKEWERSIGGEKNQKAFDLVPAHGGGWLLVGSTDEQSATGVDMLVVKVNEMGQ